MAVHYMRGHVFGSPPEDGGDPLRSPTRINYGHIRRHTQSGTFKPRTLSPTPTQVADYEDLCTQLGRQPADHFYRHGPILADGILNTMRRELKRRES